MVVIDDLWSKEAWGAIKNCFPDDSNGSRILVTTRFEEVATHVGSNCDFSHQMQLLDQSESWNLFNEKACKGHGAEFDTIGRPIVEKCKGLPLAIVVVAGLFSKLNTLDEWKNTVGTLINSSVTTTIDEECSRILLSSYNHLPYNLKACFLYLGIFPEDEELCVKDLARLWAAEGLIKTSKEMSFDVVARMYIHELNDRNLILVSQVSSCGRTIKAFRMHDLLHSFCVREAQKQNLLHVVNENGFDLPQKGFRWVSFHSENFNCPASYSFPKNCRSIFSFSQVAPLDLKFCNLVRVLYGTEAKIANLVHLRYLSSEPCDFKCLKPARAWNLQTLSISDDDDERNCLLFPQLQYLHCYSIISSCFPKFIHQKLESISWLQPDQCTRELFRKTPYLKKVKIRSDGRAWNDCTWNLTYLHCLESLQIYERSSILASVRRVVPIKNHIVHLKKLKKLTCHGMHLEWKEINIFSKLPKLEVLKLISCSCIGEEWKLSEKEKFGQLAYLEIIGANQLKQWEASAYHFPKLERLLLSRCNKLEEIPADFAEILTLELIELKHCLPSAVDSAQQILDEQHYQGNDNMFVIEEGTLQPTDSNEDDEPDEDDDDDE